MNDPLIVLVVEDNPLNMELFCDVLSADGMDVIQAGDGEECYAVLDKKLPHIILMDLQLPGKDGYTIIREIRAQEKFLHIPILALTAYAMASEREKVLETGCDGIITKPINVREFPGEIRKAVLRGVHLKKEE